MPSLFRHASLSTVSVFLAGAFSASAAHASTWRAAYDAWMDQQGRPGAQPSVDLDFDGLNNFQEFALGTSPSQKTSLSRIQKLRVVEQGGRRWAEFTYQRGISARDGGVVYEVQRSEDLVHWREATPLTLLTGKTQVSSDGEREEITLRLDEAVTEDTPLFFRLSVDGLTTAALEAEWPQVLALEDLDGTNGVAILGGREDDILGGSVSNLGDVNGDGFDDVIVGARGAGDDRNGNFSGEAYVIFGGANFGASIGTETLDGSNGFTIMGAGRDDRLGSVSAAGDVNGDGVADILVGAHLADEPEKNAGAAYVIFGNPNGFPAFLDVASLDGTNGFALWGADEWDRTGVSVANAGDLNGDGLDDIAVGADLADPEDDRSGKAYVVFGDDTGFPAVIELSALDGSNGFVLEGPGLDRFAGRDLAHAGDLNGDGASDLVISTGDRRQRSDFFRDQEIFVLFGKNVGDFPARMKLTSLSGELGFRVRFSNRANEYAAAVVAGDGDVNGDGLADLIVANEEGGVNPQAAGKIYVIFGSADGFPDVLDADALDGTDGTVLNGIKNDDNAGSSVDVVGDANGDGIDDLLIGATRANGQSDDEDFSDSGEAYLIFGRADFAASHQIEDLINSPAAVFFPGIDDDDLAGRSVSRAGDVNGDGRPDFIVGAHGADRDTDGDDRDEEDNNGAAYLIFGRTPPGNGN